MGLKGSSTYALYVLAFFMYENVLSFSVAPVWDCIVTGLAMAVISGRLLGIDMVRQSRHTCEVNKRERASET